jgi:hypothetical protein
MHRGFDIHIRERIEPTHINSRAFQAVRSVSSVITKGRPTEQT